MDRRDGLLVILAVVAIVLSASGVALADGSGDVYGVKGYFLFGGTAIDLGDLNSELKDSGYPKFEENFFAFGFGAHAMINRVILGMEGASTVARTASNDEYEVSLQAGYGFFNVGYVVFSPADLDVYPLFGLGGGAIRLDIREKGDFSFDDILDDPKRSSHLSTGGFMAQVALGADYLLALGESESGKGGLVFGFRAGYMFSPMEGDWMFDEAEEVSDAPAVSLTGPYVHIIIGGGGTWLKKSGE